MARDFKGDPYAVLGVKRETAIADIKRAYRRLAKRHHPDVDPTADAAARMARINDAYELLSDPDRRANWDAAHAKARPKAAPKAEPTARPGPSGEKAKSTAGGAPGGRASGAAGGSTSSGAAGGARQAPPPSLEEAFAYVIGFGKFRGSTLGHIAAVEPSYLRWVVRTITDRPELLARAQAVVAHLDRQAASGPTAGSTRDTRPPPRPARAPPPRATPPPPTPAPPRSPVSRPAVRTRRRAPAIAVTAVAIIAGLVFVLPRVSQPAVGHAPSSAPAAAAASATPRPTPTRTPAATPAPLPTASPDPTPAPTPFKPTAVRTVAKEVIAGINFNNNLEPYTLVLEGPKSLDMNRLSYIGFIQFDIRVSATAGSKSDCHLSAWQEDQDFDLGSGEGTWIEEARWTLDPAAGKSETAHTGKIILLGLERRLHVRSDCRAWTIKIRGVDLGHGKVPGAPKSWDGLEELDCSDFKSRADADLFLSYFGEEGSMLYELDGEGDGRACE